MTVLNVLKERGFIDNQTHEEELQAYLKKGGRHCYIGFDPTADSLHVGHLVPIMSLAHMQQHGHIPIALVGGGTGRIGDPSGKNEMRQMMTLDTIDKNVQSIKRQLSVFIDFGEEAALLANNADWLASLQYVAFLRDIGRHFSINKMVKAESYRQRIESEGGLSFIEFNYMLLQAFDFLTLFDRHDCRLQMGGSDQWGNILAGVELVRKSRQKTVFGITYKLITKSDGSKMGKTAGNAVWLDPERTSPYEYYQFWMNTDDRDVERFLSLFTFLPMPEIRQVINLVDGELNQAKNVLAFECTSLAHGREAALTAKASSAEVFGNCTISERILPSSSIPRKNENKNAIELPTTCVSRNELTKGVPAYELFFRTGLTQSGGEARRLISQGGAYINGETVTAFDLLVDSSHFKDGEIFLRAGKKRFHRIQIEDQ
ncbi:tyrosine--tRNA ligase [Desulfobacter postgatei]|jgi:tyrosyl-tRNA synthetase|uniref:Tyrosine--tRNA ligase n=1 Tax=Desulfobacter postgatei 2ac9 TaxID=879212 RepID=I5B157_9BACT|nr:tyrosine--tRNA ligase [Desulfobacter postgatei]EIM63220.1 tyrosyl-tRNA synthetase [Desulfobacter postgatei 2ac9]